MGTKLIAPEGTTSYSVDGHEYTVAEDGSIEAEAEHIDHLLTLGARHPGFERAAHVDLGDDAEDEDLSAAARLMSYKGRVETLEAEVDDLTKKYAEATNTLAERDAEIAQLREALAAAQSAPVEGAGGTSDAATDTAGGDTTGQTGDASDEGTKEPVKSVKPDNYDDMGRDDMVEWLHKHNVGIASNVSTAVAKKAMDDKIAELDAANGAE